MLKSSLTPTLAHLFKRSECDRNVYLQGYRTVLRLILRVPEPSRRDALISSWRQFFASFRAIDGSSSEAQGEWMRDCESRLRFLNTVLPFRHRLQLEARENPFSNKFLQDEQGCLVDDLLRLFGESLAALARSSVNPIHLSGTTSKPTRAEEAEEQEVGEESTEQDRSPSVASMSLEETTSRDSFSFVQGKTLSVKLAQVVVMISHMVGVSDV